MSKSKLKLVTQLRDTPGNPAFAMEDDLLAIGELAICLRIIAESPDVESHYAGALNRLGIEIERYVELAEEKRSAILGAQWAAIRRRQADV